MRSAAPRASDRRRGRWLVWFGLAVIVGLVAGACAHSRSVVPVDTREPDKFLYERGLEALKEKKWLTAREFLGQIVDNYPQSTYRPDAKLGVGDSYLGEGSTESLVLAIAEFREFLTFYPTSPRADYAQYKIGLTHFRQMRAPERDQSATREAVREFQIFVDRYPTSSLIDEVKARLRDARDRLSNSEYLIGFFYLRSRWYPGAIERFKTLLKDDPGFTRRDAVYFHLAEALEKADKKAEALPYYERLVQEFGASEYLEEARKRIAELKTPSAPPPGSMQARAEPFRTVQA